MACSIIMPDDIIRELCRWMTYEVLARFNLSNKHYHEIVQKEINHRKEEELSGLIKMFGGDDDIAKIIRTLFANARLKDEWYVLVDEGLSSRTGNCYGLNLRFVIFQGNLANAALNAALYLYKNILKTYGEVYNLFELSLKDSQLSEEEMDLTTVKGIDWALSLTSGIACSLSRLKTPPNIKLISSLNA